MPLVEGKVALVTGAGAGIGRAIALKLAAEGAKVVVSDIDPESCRATVALVTKAGGEATGIAADISRTADVAAMVAHAVATFGRLDCACNNAGIEGRVAPLLDQSDADFDRVIAVNLRGVFLCLRAEIATMLTAGGGAIVNLASVAGLVGFGGLSPYVASKHAINGLTKTAALEYAKRGIRVNAVCPGGVDTGMLDRIAEAGGSASTAEAMDPLHPIGRIGRPDEIAELAVWLCSDKASFVTGATIPIDGGLVAQ